MLFGALFLSLFGVRFLEVPRRDFWDPMAPQRVPTGSQKGVKICKKSVSKAFPEGFPFLGEKSMIFEALQTRWEGFSLESQHVFHIFACIPEGTKNEAQNLPKWRPEAVEKLFREGLKNMCFFSLFFKTRNVLLLFAPFNH